MLSAQLTASAARFATWRLQHAARGPPLHPSRYALAPSIGQPLGHLRREVRDDLISARALAARECFHRRGLLVNPTPLGGGFDQAKFARHLVSDHGYMHRVANLSDDVEIRPRRLHHHL